MLVLFGLCERKFDFGGLEELIYRFIIKKDRYLKSPITPRKQNKNKGKNKRNKEIFINKNMFVFFFFF